MHHCLRGGLDAPVCEYCIICLLYSSMYMQWKTLSGGAIQEQTCQAQLWSRSVALAYPHRERERRMQKTDQLYSIESRHGSLCYKAHKMAETHKEKIILPIFGLVRNRSGVFELNLINFSAIVSNFPSSDGQLLPERFRFLDSWR